MRYHNITKEDMLNGEGLRVVLWLAGCTHYCPGCHNPVTWDPNGGLPFTAAEEEELKRELAKPYIDGLTLSGGDPLYEPNLPELTAMVKRLKEEFPQKTIWLYTGYLWEEVRDLPLMRWIDVLVDGPFIEAQKDIRLPWRGSRNQRLIDVKTGAERK
ncbi:MAG: anaerobic ribonucleoside-triphosphate reductase activating protein [Lachnospiraceae bacterium]|nr:anaerobic ribonucleoside-triphosphate reductase activating protein [Lachnospiraceae bacterium]MDY5741621.1 anaerobic ribonucleoside-triphosphate reductase activating protein [Lachnospiraceae bacterium]